MRKPDELFRLIKTLTKSEKRYFRIHSSIHSIGGKNSYVRLFDVLDKMKEYDETVIKASFKESKSGFSFSSTKNYLSNMILKSLSEFYSAGSLRQEVNRLIEEFQILMDKGLFKQAEKKLKRAKDITAKNEMFELLLDVLGLELRLINRINYSGTASARYLVNMKEKTAAAEKLRVHNEMSYLYNEITQIWQKDKPPGTAENRWIGKNIFKNPLVKDDKLTMPDKTRLMLFRTLHIACELKYDIDGSYDYLLKIVKLGERNPAIIAQYSGHYIQSLTNLISIELSLKKYANAEKNIGKLRDIPAKIPGLKSNISLQSGVFYYTNYLQIVLYIETLQFEKGLKYIEETEAGIKAFGDHIHRYRVMQFYFFFANLNFLSGIFDEALRWLNKIQNTESKEVSPEILSFSRILRLMIHYEHNDFELIEYLVISTKRHLTKTDRTYNFEKLALSFFQKAAKSETQEALTALLRVFRGDLLELCSDPSEKDAIENLDLISWAESKLQNRPLAEIMNAKTKR